MATAQHERSVGMAQVKTLRVGLGRWLVTLRDPGVGSVCHGKLREAHQLQGSGGLQGEVGAGEGLVLAVRSTPGLGDCCAGCGATINLHFCQINMQNRKEICKISAE